MREVSRLQGRSPLGGGSGDEKTSDLHHRRIDTAMAPLSNIAPLPLSDSHLDARRWGAVVSIRYPSGVQRHPAITRIVRETVGRICATSSADERLRFSFGAEGEGEWDAQKDSQEVIGRVLVRLGLDSDAIEDAYLVAEHDGGIEQETLPVRHLTVLPDLD